MNLVRYDVVRIMCDLRYEGLWFRVDGDRLFIVGNTTKITEQVQAKVKPRKPDILAALVTIPDGCRRPTVRLLAGRCSCAVCGRWQS